MSESEATGKWQNIKPEVLEKAKQLYMGFTSISQIARETGIKRYNLQYHIYRKEENWRDMREGAKIEMLEAFSEGKKGKLIDVNNLCLSIIQKGLKDISNQEVISLKDAKMAADILTEMDKIVKLDDGQATSRTETITNKPASIADMRHRLLSADPFMETEVRSDEIKQIQECSEDSNDSSADNSSDEEVSSEAEINTAISK